MTVQRWGKMTSFYLLETVTTHFQHSFQSIIAFKEVLSSFLLLKPVIKLLVTEWRRKGTGEDNSGSKQLLSCPQNTGSRGL